MYAPVRRKRIGPKTSDEAALMTAAEHQARLSDWGEDVTFRIGLRQLLAR